MSKGKQKGIDLLASTSTSSPEPTGPNYYKITNAAGTKSSLTPVPSITVLASQFYTRDGLHRHLLSLEPATLSNMLLSQVNDDQLRPKPATPLKKPAEQNPHTHCVYCHEAFDRRQNGGCKVKHFGLLKETDKEGYEKIWTCCELVVSYVDYDSDRHVDPVDEEPYCYRGQHWEKEIEGGDGDGAAGCWWGKWTESGKNCAKRGCEGAEIIVGTGKLGKRLRAWNLI
ncbi:hypothetical protein Q9L58_004285 [Maublancomyces gigas]|uniref:Uncharacterized protein n=1 Tax=Discina gigas TaxID=1032678 RepID=A0ABR3GL88_9PEZI